MQNFPSWRYDIYQLNRTNKSGGGLAIGALKELNSVWIREGDNETEILVIEIEIQGMAIRCINGYGPQNYDNIEKKQQFWNFINAEVENASSCNAALIIQIDGNLWLGSDVLKGDPHQQNLNGKLLE